MAVLAVGMTPDASLPPADVQRPTPPLTDFDKQVAQFNEVMAMSDEEVERLANTVRSLGATPPLTDEELERTRHDHIPDVGAEQFCWECNDEWPCFMYRLVSEVERLRAQNAEYVAFIATVVRVPNAP